MEFKIKLNTPEDVREFVKAAGECNYDVDISYNRHIIDAKSILGVFSMDLNQPLKVAVHGYDEQLETVIKKYVIA
jgi:phosphotransferase system HPr-like phosphotransfer protein